MASKEWLSTSNQSKYFPRFHPPHPECHIANGSPVSENACGCCFFNDEASRCRFAEEAPTKIKKEVKKGAAAGKVTKVKGKNVKGKNVKTKKDKVKEEDEEFMAQAKEEHPEMFEEHPDLFVDQDEEMEDASEM